MSEVNRTIVEFVCIAHDLSIFATFSVAPIINISITDGGIAPNVEQSYVMTCRVYGAENLNATIEYEWRDHSSMLIGHSNNHTFTSLGLSDAGLYTCKATITSSYLTERINTTASHNVTIQSK